MKTKKRIRLDRWVLTCTLAVVLTILFSTNIFATEAAAGRPITGLQVMQYGGIIPPTPGWVFAFTPAFYSGSLGGNVQTPIGGQLVADLDVDVGFTW